MDRTFRRCGDALVVLVFGLLSSVPATARAQAWLPSDGEGAITLTYQGLFSDTHLNRNGDPFNPARISGNTVLLGLDYGWTERLAMDVKVAWVANKYEGEDLLHGPVDTGAYHGTMQDARVSLRYRLNPKRPLAVTAFAGVIVPTHNYETRGHSAPGRRLRALQLGLSVGRDLGPTGLYLQGQYAYTFVERVEGMYIDRSSADLEMGYGMTPRLTLTSAVSLQITHGGLTFPLPRDEHFHVLNPFHDRVAKADFLLFTPGGTFRITPTVDLYLTGVWTVAGRNTHAIKGVSMGTAWSFGRGLYLGQQSVRPAHGQHSSKRTAASPASLIPGR